MKYLDVILDLPPALQHPMGRFLRETDAVEREHLLAWNLSGERIEHALFHVVGDRERYADRIETVDVVEAVALEPVDATSFYAFVTQRTREEDQAWRRAFARRNLVVVPPITYDERGVRLTVVGAAAGLQTMLADLPDAVDVDVRSVGPYDHRHATLLGGLTERQREAVAVAVDLGYYERPRECDLAAVAEHLDCATGTASRLLGEAESTVMGHIAAGGLDHRPVAPGEASETEVEDAGATPDAQP